MVMSVFVNGEMCAPATQVCMVRCVRRQHKCVQ